MLVVKSQNGKTDVGISGDVVELLADLSASIRTIYESLKEKCADEEIADFFKYACVNHLMDITFDDEHLKLKDEVKKSGIDDLYEELKEKRKKSKGEEKKEQIEKLNMLFESMMKDLLDD